MYPDNLHIENLEMLVFRLVRCIEFTMKGDSALSSQSMKVISEQARDYLKRQARGPLSIIRAKIADDEAESNG